eukprot:jgi/Ulvmu1/8431/UM043_0009.1
MHPTSTRPQRRQVAARCACCPGGPQQRAPGHPLAAFVVERYIATRMAALDRGSRDDAANAVVGTGGPPPSLRASGGLAFGPAAPTGAAQWWWQSLNTSAAQAARAAP